jgi:uncharacterized phage protein (TIGR02218 family)
MRTIPSALQTHLDSPVTTTCKLLKITLADGEVIALAGLDVDVEYDDGAGLLTYKANQGADSSVLASADDLNVGNAEARSLLVTTDAQITEADIEAGIFRDAQWVLYLVNYRDLSMGHVILGAGDVGEVKKRWGMVWVPELLSYGVRLTQPIGTHWSRTCRAIFGSPANSQTGCGVDADALWRSGEVTTEGAETDRQFFADIDSSSSEDRPLVPGRVEWLTGLNTGKIAIVEALDESSGYVTLGNAMPYAIEAGDTFRIRPDCARTKAACQSYGNWPNFKGEAYIPTGDALAISTPGAQVTLESVGNAVESVTR